MGRTTTSVTTGSAVTEERFMASRFPESYPGYKRSTKMLIPFVF